MPNKTSKRKRELKNRRGDSRRERNHRDRYLDTDDSDIDIPTRKIKKRNRRARNNRTRSNSSSYDDFDELDIIPRKASNSATLFTLADDMKYFKIAKEQTSYGYLDTLMNQVYTFGTFPFNLFMSIVNMIWSGVDVTMNTLTSYTVPPIVSGYRIAKQTMGAILNIYSILFQNWVAGSVLYALSITFPSFIYDGVSLILGTTISSFLLYPFKSVMGLLSTTINVESPMFLAGMLSIGTLIQTYPGFNLVSYNITNLIYNIIGLPIEKLESTIADQMYTKWNRGGWQEVSLYLGTILSGAGLLWLVSQDLIQFWRSTGEPQIFYNLQSLFVNLVPSSLFEFGANFIHALTISQKIVGKFVVAQFPMFEQYLYSLFDLLTGKPITDTLSAIFLNLGGFFRGTSILNVLNGSVQVEPEIRVQSNSTVADQDKTLLNMWYARFDPGIVLFLNNLLYENGDGLENRNFFLRALGAMTRLDPTSFSRNLIRHFTSTYSQEDLSALVNEVRSTTTATTTTQDDSYYVALANLYNLTRPTLAHAQIASWPPLQRLMALYRILCTAAYAVVGAYIPAYSTIASIIFAFFLIGIAQWFLVRRSKFERNKFVAITQTYSVITELYNVLSAKSFKVRDLKYIMQQNANNNDLLVFDKSLITEDSEFIRKEFIKTCMHVRRKILKLATITPDNPQDDIVVRKTLPTMANALVNYVSQIHLLL